MTFDDEVPSTREPHRLTTGGAIEGFGHRSAPVDDDGLAALVGHGETADVEALGLALVAIGKPVDAPEHEGSIAEVEIGEALGEHIVDGVALETVLHRATHTCLGEVAQLPRILTAALKTAVGVIDVRLLVVEVGMPCRHGSWFMEPGWCRRDGAGGNCVDFRRIQPRNRGLGTLQGAMAKPTTPKANASKGAGTPATNVLAQAGIAYTLHQFDNEVPPGDHGYGKAAAAALGGEEGRVFKTLLVTVHGAASPTTAHAVGVVPVSGQLSLKALAVALGAKKVEMLDPPTAERLTGYVVGGISPIGQKRRLTTVIDATALDHSTVFVSGGKRGLDIEISPTDLVKVLAAVTAHIGD